jgi:hypothetical protein
VRSKWGGLHAKVMVGRIQSPHSTVGSMLLPGVLVSKAGRREGG